MRALVIFTVMVLAVACAPAQRPTSVTKSTVTAVPTTPVRTARNSSPNHPINGRSGRLVHQSSLEPLPKGHRRLFRCPKGVAYVQALEIETLL